MGQTDMLFACFGVWDVLLDLASLFCIAPHRTNEDFIFKGGSIHSKFIKNKKFFEINNLANKMGTTDCWLNVSWKKTLYENHGLPDNYTDSSFLHQLQKNIKPNNVTVKGAIALGASICIQLSIVILFVMVFVWLNNEWTTPNVIFVSSTVLTVAGYICYTVQLPDVHDRVSKNLRTALIFLTFGYILSPVLKTLTETVSTDTIYAMTIFMFLIHLIFSKYGLPQVSLSDSLSITSSIFGSLMLASRLASPLHAFSLLTVAVQCFVLLPFLLSRTENKIFISTSLTLSTLYLLILISPTLSFVFMIVTIFFHIICPLWYKIWQKYKDNIYGPWDEAVIT